VGTACARLKRWPLNARERALLKAAQEQVSRMLSEGVTEQQQAEARAALAAMNAPRQGALAFPPVRRA
jgi:hypothetical protein